MITAVGEILFDKFPDYRRIGGAPFNFVYHLQSLGLEVCFVSRIGRDPGGKEILELLHNRGLSSDYVQLDDSYRTGEVLIELDEKGNAHFNILHGVAYDHIECTQAVKSEINHSELIYFGSLMQRSEHGYQTVQAIFEAAGKGTKFLYDLNLRPDSYNEKIIRRSMEKSNVVKLNDEELSTIKSLFSFAGNDQSFINALIKDYELDMVSLTRGGAGSAIYTKTEQCSITPEKKVKVVDTVGAGDGYTAILAIGYLQAWPPEKILKTATEFAGRICGLEGALPAGQDFYTEFRSALILPST